MPLHGPRPAPAERASVTPHPPASSLDHPSALRSRWTFLDRPTPDLSLSLSDPSGADAHESRPEVASGFAVDSKRDSRGLAESDAAAVSVDEFGLLRADLASRYGQSRATSYGSRFLAVENSFNRSGSSAPDSFVDPYMAPPRPAPTGHEPTSLPYAPAPSRSTLLDLAGRPLPVDPPAVDPFSSAVARQPSLTAKHAKWRLSAASALSLPFKRSQEDLTTGSPSSSRGYWDTMLDLTASTSAFDSSDPPDTIQERPGPRPVQARPANLDMPSLPPRSYSPEPLSASQRLSAASLSSISTSVLEFPELLEREEGFYHFPVSPARPRQSTTSPFHFAEGSAGTDLSFPIPPTATIAPSSIFDRAAGSSFHDSHIHALTPSPTFSLPSSAPPPTPPPPLPGFVSVLFDPIALPQGELPPSDWRKSHVRQVDSVSSSIAAAPLRQSLRHRASGALQLEKEASSQDEKKRRTTDWLEGVAATSGSSTRSSKLRWADRAGPGWALKSEKRPRGDSLHRRRVVKKPSLCGSRRARIAAAVLIVVALLLVVGLATGLTRKAAAAALAKTCSCLHGGKAERTTDGRCSCSCSAGWGGTSCHLDATCVNGVAQGLLDVAAHSSDLWQPIVDMARLPDVLNRYILTTSSDSCASQLALLEVPSLSLSTYPNRLAWTEAALVHTLALTESNSSLSQLRTFASGLDFAQYGDEPASKPNSNYEAIVGGYTWDLATMQRTVQNVSWVAAVKPDAATAATIAAAPQPAAALDTVTNNAIAASKQRSTALAHYWNDTLGFSPAQLKAFRQAVQAADIAIPFDASSTTLQSTAQMSLPLAIACQPDLAAEVVAEIDEVEAGVFGLDNVTTAENTTCQDRPVHGLLNLLHLTQPFASSDTRSNIPQQAVVLSSSSALSDRTSVHAGETLVAGSSATASTTTSAPVSIEHFGLISSATSAIDHVLFDYLTLLPVSTAQALVNYVLSSATSPPPSSSPLVSSTLPPLEVQAWGGVNAANVDKVVSGLTVSSSNDTLFFGSSAGDALRSWAFGNTSSALAIEWSLDAQTSGTLRDSSLGGSAAFEQVWADAKKGRWTTAPQVWAALSKAGLVG
ncbi:hypothetical protein NBRC10512_002346 [Rhodotorula toruloides]|uniref:RHTO0S08e05226g1_1 n=2 Tax=Rhodotorula toruloides TaxID=5286 RepID=A0A061B1Q4_RHOTO|nr:uncharacterized protein RHTO_01029 [Rhodotorula toruloides NP11]EMS22275.1 hypothetical protein RHTO_01029 [Rhodotorula toruloides NP11]CDR43750.1 RHTO0S08e05226g1_1 [Rhodotorula toruloides]